MFSKNNKGKGAAKNDTPAATPAPPSIISADLKIVGDLHSEGEIQIDGAVEGDIRTDALLIGEQASIRGEIIAESIIIHGTINGEIKAKSVRLAKTAHVVGDIVHQDLSIEKGAFMEGHCKRFVEKPVKAEKPATEKASAAGDGASDAISQRAANQSGTKKPAAASA